MTVDAAASHSAAPGAGAGTGTIVPEDQSAAVSTQGPAGDVLVRSVSVLAGSQLVSWSTTLLWTLLVPRTLGAGEMGVYTLGQAAAGILLVVVGLGMRPLLVREIAADPSRASKLIGTSIILRAMLSVPALGIVVLVTILGHFPGDESRAILLGWAMCVFFVISEPILAAFQAMERMRYLAYSTILTNSLVNVGTIALVIVGVRATGLLLVSVVMVAVLMVLSLVWARPHFRIDWRVTWRDLRVLLVESLPYSSFAAFFTIYLWVDSFLLAALAPSTVLGWYGLPTRLFGSLMVVPVILGTAWLPQMVRAYEAAPDALYRYARPSIELVLILSMPVSVGTVLIAGPLVRALYGDGFEGSVPVLALLALCVPPMYLNIMANQVMIACKRQMVWTKVMVMASALNPVLNLYLIPHFQRSRGNGAIGAAIAMVVTEVAIAGIALILVRKVLAFKSALRLLKGLAATAVMAGAVVLGLRAGLAFGIGAGMVTFPLAAAAIRLLDAEETRRLREIVSGIGRRRRSAIREPD